MQLSTDNSDNGDPTTTTDNGDPTNGGCGWLPATYISTAALHYVHAEYALIYTIHCCRLLYRVFARCRRLPASSSTVYKTRRQFRRLGERRTRQTITERMITYKRINIADHELQTAAAAGTTAGTGAAAGAGASDATPAAAAAAVIRIFGIRWEAIETTPDRFRRRRRRIRQLTAACRHRRRCRYRRWTVRRGDRRRYRIDGWPETAQSQRLARRLAPRRRRLCQAGRWHRCLVRLPSAKESPPPDDHPGQGLQLPGKADGVEMLHLSFHSVSTFYSIVYIGIKMAGRIPPPHTTPHHSTPHQCHHTIAHYTTPHHTTPHYTTPHHIAPHRTISHHTTSDRTAPQHTTSHYTKPHHTTLHRIAPHPTTSNRTRPHHTTPHLAQNTTPHHTTSHYVTLTYITSHYVTFHHITSHHIT